MAWLESWIRGICAVVFIMAVISSQVPKNSAGRVCLMLGGIILTAVLISPLTSFDATEIAHIGRKYEKEIEKRVNSAENERDKLQKKLICEKLETYTLDRAAVAEGECNITIEIDDNGLLSAEITASDEEKATLVSDILCEDIKISKEKQKMKLR